MVHIVSCIQLQSSQHIYTDNPLHIYVYTASNGYNKCAPINNANDYKYPVVFFIQQIAMIISSKSNQ